MIGRIFNGVSEKTRYLQDSRSCCFRDISLRNETQEVLIFLNLFFLVENSIASRDEHQVTSWCGSSLGCKKALIYALLGFWSPIVKLSHGASRDVPY